MKRASILLVLALAFAVAASGAPFTRLGDPIRGQSLFVSKGCVQCHAVRGAGGRVGPDLGRTAVKGSFAELVAAMWNHSPLMDAKITEARLSRSTFEADELSDLVAFLYFLNYFDEPGDARRGKALFAQKQCIQCHAIGGEGGTIGPRLDALGRGISPLEIAQDLWNHGPTMIALMRSRGLGIPTFAGTEIVDLFAYLRTQGHRQSPLTLRSAGNPENGRRVFNQKGCARCHTVFGEGGIGPDLGRIELHGSVTQLAGRMWNHWPAMSGAMRAMGISPPVFHGDELGDVFAYLFAARYTGEPVAAPKGHSVYTVKGCASCHGQNGEGGIGPSLRELTRGESKEAIARRMWNHAPQMSSSMETRSILWPRMKSDELAGLLEYMSAWGAERSVAAKR